MHLGRGAAHDSYCSPSLGLVDVAPPSRGNNNLLYIYPAAVCKSPGLPVKRSRNVALSDRVFVQGHEEMLAFIFNRDQGLEVRG